MCIEYDWLAAMLLANCSLDSHVIEIEVEVDVVEVDRFDRWLD